MLAERALLYGGELGGSAYSNELWALWVFEDGTYSWEQKTVGGAGPGQRARHGMIFDSDQGPLGDVTKRGRIYVFGGDVAGSATSRFVHELDPWATSPLWAQWDDSDFDVTGHSVVLDEIGNARVAEVYDAATGQWQTHSAAILLQPQTYPTTFLVPGAAGDVSRVVSVSMSLSGIDTYRLDLPAQGQASPWQKFPNGALGFIPEAGVMYRPGLILAAQNNGIGITKTLDATNFNAGWQNADTMLAREDHNLVLLPDGKVLVVGGRTATPEPQIWDPATNTWGNPLAPGPAPRGYHSTAVLLPDGRVASAGGGLTTAEVLCPPYLFSGDALATRPPLTGAPQRVRYGEQFSVCMAASPLQYIASACLIRPGATTHAFDQNQRYVPLTFAQSFIPPRLVATAPADDAEAPPGDYLLFIVNTQGVPAVARWVRLGPTWPTGDVIVPAQISELYVDMVATNGVNHMGTVTGDDGMTGTASYADLRYSSSPINSEADWNAAQSVTPAPVPACTGQLQSFPVSGLAPCHTYFFAIKFGDESGNWSALGDTARATTLCGGCCGGEARAALAREEGPSPGAGRDGALATAAIGRGATPSTAASPAGASNALIVEAVPGASGLDVRLVAVEGQPTGEASELGGALYQTLEASGAWITRLQYDPIAGTRFALYAPEQPARWVILEPCSLEAMPPTVGAPGSFWQLDGARYSRAGGLTEILPLSGALPALAPGDTLAAHYAAVPATSVQPPAWLAVLSRPLGSPTQTRALGRRPETTATTPAEFALHQNQPNPFALATTIRFDLPAGAMVRLEVFDVLGRRVATLANRYYPPGYHSVEWDKRDVARAHVGPGTYFYRIEAGAMRDRRKMILLP